MSSRKIGVIIFTGIASVFMAVPGVSIMVSMAVIPCMAITAFSVALIIGLFL